MDQIQLIDFTKVADGFSFYGTDWILTNLNKFNLFVGPNNSGKSRFLRELFANFADLKRNPANEFKGKTLNYFHTHLRVNIDRLISYCRQKNILTEEIHPIETIIKSFNHSSLDYNLVAELIHLINKIEPAIAQRSDYTLNDYYSAIKNRIKNSDFFSVSLINKHTKTLYIPILRGFRPINYENERFTNSNLYLFRTTRDYFAKYKSGASDWSERIFTGLSIYEDIMALLLGDEQARKKISEFEKFLEEYIFFESVTLIPKYKDDVLHIKIGSYSQRPIYELGDGLQSIITILFPVFIRKDKGAFVFIEEPEMHLHPKWQILLLNALDSFSNFQFFLSTHSNHFINKSSTSVYRVESSLYKTYIKHLNLDEEKVDLLRNLGYKASDILQTNYIVWVEGPSDAIYFRYFMNLFDSTLEEGVHYSILFYGGENFKAAYYSDDNFDISPLSRINVNFGLYMDGDKASENDTLSAFKINLQERIRQEEKFCWISEKREIENYIPLACFEAAVKKVHKDKSNIEIPGGDLGKRTMPVDKSITSKPKARVKLPEALMRDIQRNNGQVNKVDCRLIKEQLGLAINENYRNDFSINKIAVAKEVVKLKPKIDDEEFKEKMEQLLGEIRKANTIDVANHEQ